jgi:hypothetical protein
MLTRSLVGGDAMDKDRTVYFWWLVCARGCTWEKTAMHQEPNHEWEKEGCPTCGAAYVGQVIPAPKVAS